MESGEMPFQDDELVRVGDDEQAAGEVDAAHRAPADVEVRQQTLNESLKTSEGSGAEVGKGRGQRKLVPITAGQNQEPGNFESES